MGVVSTHVSIEDTLGVGAALYTSGISVDSNSVFEGPVVDEAVAGVLEVLFGSDFRLLVITSGEELTAGVLVSAENFGVETRIDGVVEIAVGSDSTVLVVTSDGAQIATVFGVADSLVAGGVAVEATAGSQNDMIASQPDHARNFGVLDDPSELMM